MGRRGCCAAFIHARRPVKHARHGQQDGDELIRVTIGTGEFGGVAPHHLRGFEQTPFWVSPATGDHHPLLEHQREQFGVHLTQDTRRVGRPPRRDLAVTLPQFEQQFNGLITNDKFCIVRTEHLTLSWARHPLHLRRS